MLELMIVKTEHSREFKIQAVKRVEEDKIPSAQVAREYIASFCLKRIIKARPDMTTLLRES